MNLAVFERMEVLGKAARVFLGIPKPEGQFRDGDAV
jgi:hypothetical protein